MTNTRTEWWTDPALYSVEHRTTSTQSNATIYGDLVKAAETRATGSQVARIILRAYEAGWETGDIYEALNEGGYDLSFGTIESLAQTSCTR